jgi:polysaccharide biosynthesis transport protein
MNGSAPMENATAAAPVSLPGRGIKLFDSIQRHPRALILVFLAMVFAGIPFVLIKGVPIYSAGATVQVSPRFMKTLRDDIELEFQSNTQYLQFIQQQIRTFTRHDVLASALKQLDARYAGQPHPWRIEGESERRSIYRLQRSLRVFHVRDSYLIQIMLDSPHEAGIEDVVNTVVDVYLTVARNEHVYGADQRVSQLEQRQTDLLAQIEQLTTERTAIAQTLGVTAFNPADMNPFDRQMQRLLEEHTDTRTRRIDAETRLTGFLTQGETDLAIRSISESVLTDPGLNSLKASLNQRRAILLTAMSGLAENHPARLDAVDELASIEAEITLREEALRSQLAKAVEKRYRNSAEQAQVIEQALARTIDEVREQGRDYAEGFNRALSLNNHIVLLWNELDRVRDRLNFFESEEAAPGFVRLETPAMPPLYPSGAGKKKLLIIVLIAAGGVALATPVLIDLLDRRIRTVNDAHRVLGFAPMGWMIAHGSNQPNDEAAFVGEQLRRIGSAMIREKDRHGTRTIAFTSVKPGGGTTWIVRALTTTLNQLGYRALAVEANAYHPNPVYLVGHPMANRQMLADQSRASPVSGLRYLLNNPDGDIVLNESDPLLPCLHTLHGQPALQNLKNLPAALKRFEEYDFILLDAPPLLTSADAELVVRSCDGGVIVARAGDIGKGELSRAVRMMQRVDPRVTGAIVNAIEAFRGGGYVSEMMSEFSERRRIGSASLIREAAATLAILLREAGAMAGATLMSPVTAVRYVFGKLSRR